MKVYCTPRGVWTGNEKDWRAALKVEGVDPKTMSRKVIEVPTDKPGLLEFLTFHRVNVIAPQGPPPATDAAGSTLPPPAPLPAATTMPVDVEALRALHNPQTNADRPAGAGADAPDLDTLFLAAPLGQQLTLAAIACENGFKACPR